MNIRYVCITVNTEQGKKRLIDTKKHFEMWKNAPMLHLHEVKPNTKNPREGCATSHRDVAEESLKLFKNDQTITTVLECDSRPFINDCNAWHKYILPFAHSVGEIDIVFGGLSGASFVNKQKKIRGIWRVPDTKYHLLYVKSGTGFFHYAPVSRRGYEAIVITRRSNERRRLRDIDLQVFCNSDVNCFVVVPSVASTTDGFSLIRNRDAHFSTRCDRNNTLAKTWIQQSYCKTKIEEQTAAHLKTEKNDEQIKDE